MLKRQNFKGQNLKRQKIKKLWFSCHPPLKTRYKFVNNVPSEPSTNCTATPHFQPTRGVTPLPNQIFTRGITLKRVASGEAHLHGLAPGQHSSKETSQRW